MSEGFDDLYESDEEEEWGLGISKDGVGFKTTLESGTPRRLRGKRIEEGEGEYDENDPSQIDEEEFKMTVNEILEEMLREYDFLSEGDTITKVIYRGHVVLVATENTILFSGPDSISRYDSTKGIIKKVFMSGNGNHIIYCLKDHQVFYVNTSIKDFKPYSVRELTHDVRISSLFFEGLGASSTSETERIIFGTYDGRIFEMSIGVSNRRKPVCSYSRIFQLNNRHVLGYLQLGDQPFQPEVTGIQVVKQRRRRKKPNPNAKSKEDSDISSILVLITTQQFIFEFVGRRDYRRVFEYYRTEVQSPNPSNTLNFFRRTPKLQGHYIKNSKPELHFLRGRTVRFKSFAWVCESGIYHGRLSLSKAKEGESCIEEAELIRTDDTLVTAKSRKAVPLTVVSIVITEFHLYVLYESKLVVYLLPPDLCTHVWVEGDPDSQAVPISEIKVVFEHRIHRNENARGLYLWQARGRETVVLYTDQSVYETIVDEKTLLVDVWRLYLNKACQSSQEAYFRLAEGLANGIEEKNVVLTARADFYFENDFFEKAAEVYALTSHNFEQVVVKFNENGEKDALRSYLKRKLAIVKKHSEDSSKGKRSNNNNRRKKKIVYTFKTQMTCLCTWLTELYLDKLNQLREERREYERIKKEFQKFLQENKEYLHKETTFRLISSHGKLQELIFFAVQIREYEFVINHYLVKERYDKALKVLMKYCSKSKKYQEIWYKFAPVLIEHLPNELFKTLKQEKLTFLDTRRLLPSFMRYISLHKKEKLIRKPSQSILGYLQWIIRKRKNRDPTIHNLLLFLYAQLDDDAFLLEFLSKSQYYDKEYALRICLENKRIQACIFLYSQLEQYEDAIQLALDIRDVELAKSFALQSQTTVEKTKKLWLKIAKYVIENGDVKDSLKLLYLPEEENLNDEDDNNNEDGGGGYRHHRKKKKKSSEQKNPYLKFENLLPFFPDNALIDDFKDEICKSLKTYNKEIGTLKSEMQSQSNDLNEIREDIKKLKHKFYQIDPEATCDSCRFTILPSLFYIFPCDHIFHYECLIRETINFASFKKHQQQQQEEKEKEENNNNKRRSLKGGGGRSEKNNKKKKKKKNLSKVEKAIKLKRIWKKGMNPHMLSSHQRKQLDDLINDECPYCGTLMIDSIGDGFLSNVSKKEAESWDVKMKISDAFVTHKRKSGKKKDGGDDEELEGENSEIDDSSGLSDDDTDDTDDDDDDI